MLLMVCQKETQTDSLKLIHHLDKFPSHKCPMRGFRNEDVKKGDALWSEHKEHEKTLFLYLKR